MRLILLMLALLITGLLVMQTLSTPKAPAQTTDRDPASAQAIPQVPQHPQDLQRFKQEMNQFVDQAARDRAREIDAATGR